MSAGILARTSAYTQRIVSDSWKIPTNLFRDASLPRAHCSTDLLARHPSVTIFSCSRHQRDTTDVSFATFMSALGSYMPIAVNSKHERMGNSCQIRTIIGRSIGLRVAATGADEEKNPEPTSLWSQLATKTHRTLTKNLQRSIFRTRQLRWLLIDLTFQHFDLDTLQMMR